MYNHNKAQQSKNRVHISWDILYLTSTYLAWFDELYKKENIWKQTSKLMTM